MQQRPFRVAFMLSLALGAQAVGASACHDAHSRYSDLRAAWIESGEGEADLLDAARAVRQCESLDAELRIAVFRFEHSRLQGTEDVERWIELLRYAADHLAPLADTDFAIDVNFRTAINLRRTGRHLEAIPYLQEAVSLSVQAPRARQAEMLISLSIQYSYLHDQDRAIALAREAESLMRDEPGLVLGRAILRQADAVWLQAYVEPADPEILHWALGQAARAGEIFAASDVPEFDKVRRLAFVERTRASLLLILDRPDEASVAAANAVRYTRTTGDRNFLIQHLEIQAEAEFTAGRTDVAREVLAEVLQSGVASPTRQGRAHLLLGRMHLAEGDMAAAEASFRKAIESLEFLRRSLGTTDWSLMRVATSESAYRDYAGLLLHQGRATEAFAQVDAERARYLRDVRRLAAVRDDDEVIRRLNAELRGVLDSLRVATDRAPVELLGRRDRLQTEIARRMGYEASDEMLDVSALQERLAVDGRVLISYFLDDPPHAFVVTADTFLAVPIPATLDAIEAQVRALDLPSAADQLLVSGIPRLRPEPLHELYRMLFAPVAAHVPEGAPVTVVPDRGGGELPFGMLLTDLAEPYAYDRWPYLVYRNAFSIELAAALLLEEPRKASGRWPVVAFGRSGFEGIEAPPPFQGTRLISLPHVHAELRAIRRIFSGSLIAVDEGARESDLYALLPEARILHLASHALVSHEVPMHSAVILSPDAGAEGPEADGVVHLYELVGRQLDAALVVLSGCSTARGRARLSEGVIGLHYGFRAAGAQASVATMWPIEDAAMAGLMASFYRHLSRGAAKDVALREAQLEYLRSAPRAGASPFFWAAPVLAGDPSPVDLARGAASPRTWWLLGSLLLLAGVLLGRLHTTRRVHD